MRRDYKLHMIYSSAIVVFVLLGFLLFVKQEMYGWDKGIAGIVALLISAGKEIVWDKLMKKGTPEFYDFFYSMLAACATIIGWVIIESVILEIIR